MPPAIPITTTASAPPPSEPILSDTDFIAAAVDNISRTLKASPVSHPLPCPRHSPPTNLLEKAASTDSPPLHLPPPQPKHLAHASTTPHARGLRRTAEQAGTGGMHGSSLHLTRFAVRTSSDADHLPVLPFFIERYELGN